MFFCAVVLFWWYNRAIWKLDGVFKRKEKVNESRYGQRERYSGKEAKANGANGAVFHKSPFGSNLPWIYRYLATPVVTQFTICTTMLYHSLCSYCIYFCPLSQHNNKKIAELWYFLPFLWYHCPQILNNSSQNLFKLLLVSYYCCHSFKLRQKWTTLILFSIHHAHSTLLSLPNGTTHIKQPKCHPA